MKTLTLVYIGDGYLAAGTDKGFASNAEIRRYFGHGDLLEQDYCIVETEVPNATAERLMAYFEGNSGPEPFSDGYEAANYANFYQTKPRTKLLFCSVEWPNDSTHCYLCGELH